MSEQTPPGSIIERFRGTEWGTPEPVPPPPPRRRGPFAVIAAFVVAIGALVAVVMLASMPPAGARPDLRASFLPDDGVTPRVPDSIRVLDAFWSIARDPDLAYHLEGTGSARAEGFDQSFELSLDVVGDDFTGTVNTIGGTGLAEFIRLDHVVYLRPTGKAWIILRTDNVVLRQAPFMGLEGRRELLYDGSFEAAGVTRHRLLTTEFYAPSVERMLDLSQFGFDRTDTLSLELIVADDGTPVRASFTCIVKASLVDRTPGFEGTAEYTFSAFGDPVVIQTPAP